MHVMDMNILVTTTSGQCGGCVKLATTMVIVNNQQGWKVCDEHFRSLILDIHENMMKAAKSRQG